MQASTTKVLSPAKLMFSLHSNFNFDKYKILNWIVKGKCITLKMRKFEGPARITLSNDVHEETDQIYEQIDYPVRRQEKNPNYRGKTLFEITMNSMPDLNYFFQMEIFELNVCHHLNLLHPECLEDDLKWFGEVLSWKLANSGFASGTSTFSCKYEPPKIGKINMLEKPVLNPKKVKTAAQITFSLALKITPISRAFKWLFKGHNFTFKLGLFDATTIRLVSERTEEIDELCHVIHESPEIPETALEITMNCLQPYYSFYLNIKDPDVCEILDRLYPGDIEEEFKLFGEALKTKLCHKGYAAGPVPSGISFNFRKATW